MNKCWNCGFLDKRRRKNSYCNLCANFFKQAWRIGNVEIVKCKYCNLFTPDLYIYDLSASVCFNCLGESTCCTSLKKDCGCREGYVGETRSACPGALKYWPPAHEDHLRNKGHLYKKELSLYEYQKKNINKISVDTYKLLTNTFIMDPRFFIPFACFVDRYPFIDENRCSINGIPEFPVVLNFNDKFNDPYDEENLVIELNKYGESNGTEQDESKKWNMCLIQ